MSNQCEKIKQLMRQQKMSIQTLSQSSGIARSTLTKLLNGSIKSIKAQQLTAIANALGVSMAELFDSNIQSNTIATSSKLADNYGFVKVACATVKLKLADCDWNALQIAQRAQALAQKSAKIISFGELSITGYTCADLFAQQTLLDGALKALKYLATKTEQYDCAVIVGLPYRYNSRIYNTAGVLFKGKLVGLVPKTYLPNYNEYYEKRYFSSAMEGIVYTEFDGYTVPFGTNIMFAVQQDSLQYNFTIEICEDLWVATPPSLTHAQNGAHIIVNLSASNETIGKAEFRANLVKMQSAKCTCAYMYTSTGEGESTSDLLFSGHNIIAENGKLLKQTPLFSCQSALTDIDIQYINYQRTKSFNTQCHNYLSNYTTVQLDMHATAGTLDRQYSRQPFVPQHNKDDRMKLILDIQANALKNRIEHINCRTLVIGVSGGLDSSLALIVCVRALQLLNRPTTDIVAVTMPCFGTTERTLSNSVALAKALNTTVKKVDITKAVMQHFEDIGHDCSVADVTFENSQARERTQILMDIANQTGGIVIGTGDLSELALGWATYNGDHMSMYGLNCSVPKTLIRHLINYIAKCEMQSIAPVLLDIIDTPVSPELLPKQNNEIVQKTEDIVGPYELHDFFIYHMIHNGWSPKKILYIAKHTFDDYTTEDIKKWLRIFVKRFFQQQFKRNCLPDGIKIGSVALSPRGDWRMPADSNATLWLEQLDD